MCIGIFISSIDIIKQLIGETTMKQIEVAEEFITANKLAEILESSYQTIWAWSSKIEQILGYRVFYLDSSKHRLYSEKDIANFKKFIEEKKKTGVTTKMAMKAIWEGAEKVGDLPQSSFDFKQQEEQETDQSVKLDAILEQLQKMQNENRNVLSLDDPSFSQSKETLDKILKENKQLVQDNEELKEANKELLSINKTLSEKLDRITDMINKASEGGNKGFFSKLFGK